MGRSLWAKKPLIYFGLFVVLLIAAITLFSGGGDSETIPLVGGTESLLGRLRTQTSQIDRVEIDGSKVRIAYNDGRAFQAAGIDSVRAFLCESGAKFAAVSGRGRDLMTVLDELRETHPEGLPEVFSVTDGPALYELPC